MSQENVEIVRRFGEAWQRGDFAAALSTLDENVEWCDQVAIPGAEVHRGREAVRRHFEQWLDAWKEIDYTAEEVLDPGNCVVVMVRRCGKGARSGAEVNDRVTYVYTVCGEKIVRFEAFTDKAEALEAVELRE
jgi:uncharacterized protein